jgi:2-polyprenyl-3-methyl-5-hydroxy-6-metoxy-1,4-benzoquinol methylase
MPDFSERSTEIEIMDDLNCAGSTLDQTLRELEFINKWLGGNVITINALNDLLTTYDKSKAISIADLGCGNGDMLRIISEWGTSRGFNLKLVGIDANAYIIKAAQKHLEAYPHIEFQALNIFSEDFQKQKFDVVIGTLFYHHFSNEQLINFFSQLKHQIRIGFIINDIHRHWLAYYSIKALTQAFSKSSMVKYDAPLSVLRAFKRRDLKHILQASQIAHYTIQWKWAFRWQVVAKHFS